MDLNKPLQHLIKKKVCDSLAMVVQEQIIMAQTAFLWNFLWL